MSNKANGAEAYATTPLQVDLKQVEDTKLTAINPVFDLNNLNNLDKHLSELKPYPASFPLNVFPDKIAGIIKAKSDALGFPIDFAAGAAFSSIATAIGNSCRSIWMGGYDVTTNLFMVFVAPPGSNKSQPIKDAYKIIEKKDNENYNQYQIEYNEWEKAKASADKDLQESLKKPVLIKTIVSDCTLEALANVCSNNPRGIVSHNDELAGWLKDLNKYNNGGALEQWLSIFNCTPFNIDRVGRKSNRVSNPCISIIGTIQPAILDDFAKDNRDQNGFMDRLLFIKPANLKTPVWAYKVIDENIMLQWEEFVLKVLGINFKFNGEKDVPNNIPFSEEAVKVLIDWQKNDIDTDDVNGDQSIKSISAKLYIYILRFALVIQVSRAVCGEASMSEIDEESARRAIELAKYFKGQAVDISRYIKCKNPAERLTQIQKEIYNTLPPIFTTAEGVSITKQVSEHKPEGFGMSQRAFEYWLNDTKLFTKIKHGQYQKIH